MVSHFQNGTTSYLYTDDAERFSSESPCCSDYTAYETGDDSLSNLDDDGVYLYNAGDETYPDLAYDVFETGSNANSIRSLSAASTVDTAHQNNVTFAHRQTSAPRMESMTVTNMNNQPTSQGSRINNKDATGKHIPQRKPAIANTVKGHTPEEITQETIDKVRETELEDILMNAKDISHPDPQAQMSFCSRPSKLVEGTFRHLLSVKELHSTTGAFKYRNIEMKREQDSDLGFSVRQGDGWEKRDGIFVSRLSLGSPFDLYELISIGDEVVKINNVDVRKMRVDDVVRLMHLPEKLTITIKALTPFSKKRVAKSSIAKGVTSKRFVGKSKRTQDSNYKIANMKIGKTPAVNPVKKDASAADASGTQNPQKKTSSPVHNDKTTTTQGKSPYRALPNGALTPTRLLSPIREDKSEARSTLTGKEDSHSVSWSDQRS